MDCISSTLHCRGASPPNFLLQVAIGIVLKWEDLEKHVHWKVCVRAYEPSAIMQGQAQLVVPSHLVPLGSTLITKEDIDNNAFPYTKNNNKL
jgi:hypothetical protein